VSLQDHFTVWNVLRKLSEIVAGDGLHGIVWRVEALINKHFDQTKVILVCLELPCILLPELLLMARSPSELLSLNLFLEFRDGAVNFLVLFEIRIEFIKHLVDVFVNPMAILQLNN